MNAGDAAARGIADGDRVRVFDDRGSTVLPVKVRSAPCGATTYNSNMIEVERAAQA